MNLVFVVHVGHAGQLYLVWNQATMVSVGKPQVSSQSGAHSHAHTKVSQDQGIDV